jgi:hypothetical protein
MRLGRTLRERVGFFLRKHQHQGAAVARRDDVERTTRFEAMDDQTARR